MESCKDLVTILYMEQTKNILEELDKTLKSRKKEDIDSSYVASLFNEGISAMTNKILEEAQELVETANSNGANKKNLVHETADLWFHTLVLLSYENITSVEILNELSSRFGVSGLKEKQNR